jgi:iron complex transport system ATP-binding protein
MAKPKVLILDEPCAGLDPAAREHFLRFLERLGRSRTAPALIFVSHHVEEITSVFSHLLILKAGTVLAAGPKNAVMKTRLLAEAFGARVRLGRMKDRYTLAVSPTKHVVI